MTMGPHHLGVPPATPTASPSPQCRVAAQRRPAAPRPAPPAPQVGNAEAGGAAGAPHPTKHLGWTRSSPGNHRHAARHCSGVSTPPHPGVPPHPWVPYPSILVEDLYHHGGGLIPDPPGVPVQQHPVKKQRLVPKWVQGAGQHPGALADVHEGDVGDGVWVTVTPSAPWGAHRGGGRGAGGGGWGSHLRWPWCHGVPAPAPGRCSSGAGRSWVLRER